MNPIYGVVLMRGYKAAFVAGALFFVAACDHPIEIVGQGDVLSASGDRNCLLEEFQAGNTNCTKNTVVSAYKETYFAVPRSGWQFSRWENYCTDVTDPNMTDCGFEIPGGTVFDFWGKTMPSLTAVFTQDSGSGGDEWPLEGSQASYSATRELRSEQGTFSMKEYAEPDKMRLEITQAGQTLVFINREDLTVAWQLFLARKFYSEISLDQFADQASDDLNIIEYSKVGTETISGLVTDKYRIVAEDNEGNRGEGFYWVSRSGILVQAEVVIKDGQAERTFLMTLKDIVEGDQPDSLFEIPDGFSKLPSIPSLPGLPGVPGDLPGLPDGLPGLPDF